MSSRGGYLLDTNHLGAATTTTPVRRRLAELRCKGARIGTCVPVLFELEAGTAGPESCAVAPAIGPTASPDSGLANRPTTARIYGELYTDLRRRGRVLSQVDMMLAALALQLGLTLVTTDSDFDALPDLKREDWTA